MNDIDRRTRDNPEKCMGLSPSVSKPDPLDEFYKKIEIDKKAGSDRACIDCRHMRISSMGAECHKKAFSYRDPITGESRIERAEQCIMNRFNSSTNWSGEHKYCGYEGSWFEPKESK